MRVVDASAAASILFGEPEGARIAREMRGHRLLAPALIEFELANVCLLKRRWSPEQAGCLADGFAMRARLGIEHYAVDHEAVLTLAAQTGLTAYAASYLWMAETSGAVLLTLDRVLLALVETRARG